MLHKFGHNSYLVRVRKTLFGIKYLFWSPQSWMQMVQLPVKNVGFGNHKNRWKCPQLSFKISSGATKWCPFDWFVTCKNGTTVSSTSSVKRDMARLLQMSASDGYVVYRNVNCHYILVDLGSTGFYYFINCSHIGLEWKQVPAVTFLNLLEKPDNWSGNKYPQTFGHLLENV